MLEDGRRHEGNFTSRLRYRDRYFNLPHWPLFATVDDNMSFASFAQTFINSHQPIIYNDKLVDDHADTLGLGVAIAVRTITVPEKPLRVPLS